MRKPSIPGLFVGALVLAPLAVAPPAQAQQRNPSAAQIIQSLTPSGNLTSGHTRGIRLANPTAGQALSPQQQAPTADHPAAQHAPAAAAETHMATNMPAAPQHAPSVNLNVDFATGSADLTPSARSTLDQLGQALTSQQLANYRFKIVGHTDTVGSPAVNQALSERRADAVAAYLEQKFSVPAARLDAIGVGEKGLLVATPPQTPNQKNRRVEVINLGA